jgi:uncharacterized protein (DUF1697 family)
MPRFIAFLRAINVGGHTVRMEHLRQLFVSLGFSKVETFIASGNVLFETRAKSVRTLETKIEKGLLEALGYEVATFVRTLEELAEIADYVPFRQEELDAAAALNIGFLHDPLDDQAKRKLMALRTSVDDFHVHGREIYWLCRLKQSDSAISNNVIQKALGRQTTFRGANTIRKMAAKYA